MWIKLLVYIKVRFYNWLTHEIRSLKTKSKKTKIKQKTDTQKKENSKNIECAGFDFFYWGGTCTLPDISPLQTIWLRYRRCGVKYQLINQSMSTYWKKLLKIPKNKQIILKKYIPVWLIVVCGFEQRAPAPRPSKLLDLPSNLGVVQGR